MNPKSEAGGYLYGGIGFLTVILLLGFFFLQNKYTFSTESFDNFVDPIYGNVYTIDNYANYDVPIVFKAQIAPFDSAKVNIIPVYSNSDLIADTGYSVWMFYNPFSGEFNSADFETAILASPDFSAKVDEYKLIYQSDVLNLTADTEYVVLFGSYLHPDSIGNVADNAVYFLEESTIPLADNQSGTVWMANITSSPIPFGNWIKTDSPLASDIKEMRYYLLIGLTICSIFALIAASFKSFTLNIISAVILIASIYFGFVYLNDYFEMSVNLAITTEMAPFIQTLSVYFVNYWPYVFCFFAIISSMLTVWGIVLED